MVPPRSIPHKLHLMADRLRERGRALLWGLGLWALLVALPYAWLFPGQNLARPVCIGLALAGPFGMLLAATWAETHLLLGVGLVALVPVLVACPELVGPRITGAVQGLAVAVVLIGFIAAVVDASAGPAWRVQRGQKLRRLMRRPERFDEVLLLVMGVVWLIMAWVAVGGVEVEQAERIRTARVASVAVLWMAVRVVPVTWPSWTRTPERLGDWSGLVLRRLPWLIIWGGVLWWWRR